MITTTTAPRLINHLYVIITSIGLSPEALSPLGPDFDPDNLAEKYKSID
jgi:hypothetical protein